MLSYFQVLILVAILLANVSEANENEETLSRFGTIQDTKFKSGDETFFSIDCNSDIVFLLDGSVGSGGDNFEKVKKWVTNSVEVLPKENTMVGVVLNSFAAKVILNLTTVSLNHTQSINETVNAMESPNLSSNVNDGLAASLQLFQTSSSSRSNVTNLLIVVTAGPSTHGLPHMTDIFASDISTLAVGVGKRVEDQELNLIAGNDSSRIHRISNHDKLLLFKPKIRNNASCDTKLNPATAVLTVEFITPAVSDTDEFTISNSTYADKAITHVLMTTPEIGKWSSKYPGEVETGNNPTDATNEQMPSVVTINQNPNSESPNLIYVIGSVVGFVVILLIVIIILLKLQVSRQQTIIQQRIPKEEEHAFKFGQVIQNSAEYTDSALIQARPYDINYEILREHIIIYKDKILGSGHFGIVYEGEVQCPENTTNTVRVAVKTVRPNVDLEYLRALLSEIKVMTFVGRHSHIVNLIGACTKQNRKNQLFLAVEYCSRGNLKDFMRTKRGNFKNQIEDGRLQKWENYDDSCVYTRDLIRWSSEIAHAMAFLSGKKVIHMDLACRNILLTDKLVAKMSDFGLSRQLINYSNYVKKKSCPLPWKWLALESLKDMEFFVKSDVWSYGVLLWEVFSLGEVPYLGQVWSQDFIVALESGERLRMPTFATKSIYELMSQCWNIAPSARPDFVELRETFSGLLAKISNQDYLDLFQNEYDTLSNTETSAIGNNYI